MPDEIPKTLRNLTEVSHYREKANKGKQARNDESAVCYWAIPYACTSSIKAH